jgi:hypothetical protein
MLMFVICTRDWLTLKSMYSRAVTSEALANVIQAALGEIAYHFAVASICAPFFPGSTKPSPFRV